MILGNFTKTRIIQLRAEKQMLILLPIINLIQVQQGYLVICQQYVHCNEIRGREHFHVDYYEQPTNFDNAVEIDTTNKSVTESFQELWKKLL